MNHKETFDRLLRSLDMSTDTDKSFDDGEWESLYESLPDEYKIQIRICSDQVMPPNIVFHEGRFLAFNLPGGISFNYFNDTLTEEQLDRISMSFCLAEAFGMIPSIHVEADTIMEACHLYAEAYNNQVTEFNRNVNKKRGYTD